MIGSFSSSKTFMYQILKKCENDANFSWPIGPLLSLQQNDATNMYFEFYPRYSAFTLKFKIRSINLLRYISYFLKLEEGEPPLHYHPDEAPKTSEQFLEEYLQDHRNKNIRKW